MLTIAKFRISSSFIRRVAYRINRNGQIVRQFLLGEMSEKYSSRARPQRFPVSSTDAASVIWRGCSHQLTRHVRFGGSKPRRLMMSKIVLAFVIGISLLSISVTSASAQLIEKKTLSLA